MARSKSRLLPRNSPPAAPVQGSLDTLTQGVSQQPPHLRAAGQGEAQVNGWSSPVAGLAKRRPTRFVSKISPQPLTDFYLEMFQVSADERYSVLVTAGRMEILRSGASVAVDVHGTGLTLTTLPDGRQQIASGTGGYLNVIAELAKSYALISSGPLALLLNRTSATALDAATTPAQANEALLFIQGVAYEITYALTLNGAALPVYTTPKATDTANQLSTDTVALELTNRVNAVAGFTATRVGSVVHVRRTDAGAFTCNLADGRAGTLARSLQTATPSFAGLPTIAPNGFLLRIDGAPGSAQDDYWVKFATRDGGAFGEGVWQEAPAPGMQYKIAPNTMPLVIYRKAPGVMFVGPADGATRTLATGGSTYTYTFPKWGERTAGSGATLPAPSFVGQAIRDHVLFRSRYAVVAGESVVLSEVDDVFNFWGDTSLQTLDTDPIDLRAASESSAPLEWILPIDESLLVFSQKSQFQVRPADADVLTPKTAVCLRLSNIEMNAHLRPRLAGPNVMFATDEYGYTGFREYQFFDTQQRRLGINLGGSLNVTQNVPKYIKGLATHWDVGETLDYAVCSTPDDRKRIYVYKYLWQSGQGSVYKQQASWSEWKFDGDVQWMKFMDNQLWLVMSYQDGTYAVHIDSDELDDPAFPGILLDRLLLYPECNLDSATSNNVAASYDPETRLTTFTLPYQIVSTTDAVIRFVSFPFSGPQPNAGLQLGTATNGNTITCRLPGDWRSAYVAIGARYLFSYEFTRAYRPSRDQARQKVIGDLNGRLQVATWTAHHSQAGRYDVVVKRRNRAIDSRHQFWARFLNVGGNRLDGPETQLETGSFRVPVHSRNTDCRVIIESDSWLPLTITGASWEATYSDRSRSLS